MKNKNSGKETLLFGAWSVYFFQQVWGLEVSCNNQLSKASESRRKKKKLSQVLYARCKNESWWKTRVGIKDWLLMVMQSTIVLSALSQPPEKQIWCADKQFKRINEQTEPWCCCLWWFSSGVALCVAGCYDWRHWGENILEGYGMRPGLTEFAFHLLGREGQVAALPWGCHPAWCLSMGGRKVCTSLP